MTVPSFPASKNPYWNHHYHAIPAKAEFYEAEFTSQTGKKLKVHKIKMVVGNTVIDEIASAQDKANYPAEYKAFLKSIKTLKNDHDVDRKKTI